MKRLVSLLMLAAMVASASDVVASDKKRSVSAKSAGDQQQQQQQRAKSSEDGVSTSAATASTSGGKRAQQPLRVAVVPAPLSLGSGQSSHLVSHGEGLDSLAASPYGSPGNFPVVNNSVFLVVPSPGNDDDDVEQAGTRIGRGLSAEQFDRMVLAAWQVWLCFDGILAAAVREKSSAACATSSTEGPSQEFRVMVRQMVDALEEAQQEAQLVAMTRDQVVRGNRGTGGRGRGGRVMNFGSRGTGGSVVSFGMNTEMFEKFLCSSVQRALTGWNEGGVAAMSQAALREMIVAVMRQECELTEAAMTGDGEKEDVVDEEAIQKHGGTQRALQPRGLGERAAWLLFKVAYDMRQALVVLIALYYFTQTSQGQAMICK